MSEWLARLGGVGLTFLGAAAPALSRVDLEVNAGETLCLLGPSGCGKSTILRVIAGLQKPDAGRLEWAGGAPAKIGFVFQDANLMPWADVFANVHLPLRLQGMGRREAGALVADALERVGLADRARALPRELSGGMKMRVSIARALVDRPALLLLDEPFAALDEITRWQLNDMLLDLGAQGAATVVFVTHSVFESAYLADRVAVMRARPGTIDAVLPLARAETRSRRGPDFERRCAEIEAALRRAMEGAPRERNAPGERDAS